MANAPVVVSVSGNDKCSNASYNNSQRPEQRLLVRWRDVKRISVFSPVIALLFLVVYNSEFAIQPLSQLISLSPFASKAIPTKPDSYKTINTTIQKDARTLEEILREASTKEKTVILTTLNRAWAEPNSTFQLFLESFHIGQGTKRLLHHLVVICLDEEAYSRCLEVHPRGCYLLKTAGVDFSGQKNFMTRDYLRMMWRRIEFLCSVLKLGYNFIFTDMDVMWLRDPFPHFFSEIDFQIACDHFNGNSNDARNYVNGGFNFVRANNRTIKFYNYWHGSRWRYQGKHDQDVFNKIKHDHYVTKTLGLTMRFLDTLYFRGFCQMSPEMDKVCTMHANCCIGLQRKVIDLRHVLEDWKDYSSMADRRNMTWRTPDNCWRRVKKSNKTLVV